MAIAVSNKKGQSIIEVMISLTILALVLSSSIVLIVSVVNLAMNARTKTEVVTFAQSGLAKIVSSAEGGCLVNAGSTPSDSYPGDATITRTAQILALTGGENYGGLTNFMKARVDVAWKNKAGTTQHYVLTQLVRTVGN